jgi:hypothetical protein
MASDDTSQSEFGSASGRGLVVGDRVRIRRGTLAGLTGSVVGFTSASGCILRIDGLVEGVRVIVFPDALEPSQQQVR